MLTTSELHAIYSGHQLSARPLHPVTEGWRLLHVCKSPQVLPMIYYSFGILPRWMSTIVESRHSSTAAAHQPLIPLMLPQIEHGPQPQELQFDTSRATADTSQLLW